MDNKELLELIIAKLDEIEYDIKKGLNDITKEIVHIKTDVQSLNTNIVDLHSDVKSLKNNMETILETDLQEVKKKLQFLAEGKDPDQAWFWTNEWQQAEEEAEEEIRNGQTKSFNNVADLLADLHKDDDEIEERKSIPPLDQLLKKITPKNKHDEIK